VYIFRQPLPECINPLSANVGYSPDLFSTDCQWGVESSIYMTLNKVIQHSLAR